MTIRRKQNERTRLKKEYLGDHSAQGSLQIAINLEIKDRISFKISQEECCIIILKASKHYLDYIQKFNNTLQAMRTS